MKVPSQPAVLERRHEPLQTETERREAGVAGVSATPGPQQQQQQRRRKKAPPSQKTKKPRGKVYKTLFNRKITCVLFCLEVSGQGIIAVGKADVGKTDDFLGQLD